MTEDTDKSHLRLASENSETDLARERAKRDIEWPLRELAANIIRVVRGAGKSYNLGRECAAVVVAFEKYHEKVGHWPSSWDIEQALLIREEAETPAYDEWWERSNAIETIIRGALQVTASRLVYQNTQERRGETELSGGVNRLERAREEIRKKRAEEQKAERQRLAKPTSKTRSKGLPKAKPVKRES